MKWTNWSRTIELHTDVACPRTLTELQQVLIRAHRRHTTIRAFGARHSHSAVAAPTGLTGTGLDLQHFDSIDIDGDLVHVGAGVRIHQLTAALAAAGRALPNLGDINTQTIAGAISTGTHGTGLEYGSLAAGVLALQLVLPSGDVVEASCTQCPELFAAATVGLGLFGIITRVSLRTVPLFYLSAHESAVSLPSLLSDLDGFFEGIDHGEFYIFPGTQRALLKDNRRTEVPATARSTISRLWSEEVVENGLLQLASSLSSAVPSLIRPLNQVAARTVGTRHYQDTSAEVFTSPRRVRFREIEYAIPYETLTQTLSQVLDYINDHRLRLSFPIEVRVGPADAAWLSPAHGRRTAYIAVQQYAKLAFPHFAEIEEILAAPLGRPHWGKLHTQRAASLAQRYPYFEQAVALRTEIDPTGVLGSPYLSELLG